MCALTCEIALPVPSNSAQALTKRSGRDGPPILCPELGLYRS